MKIFGWTIEKKVENPVLEKLLEAPYPARAYGLVDFRDLDFKATPEDTRKAHVAAIAGARTAIEWALKEMIAAQINKWSRGAWTDAQKAFHNGAMNGFDLVIETVENFTAENEENSKPKSIIDPTRAPLSSGGDLDII